MADVRKLIALAENPPPIPDLPEVALYEDPQNPEITSGSKAKRPWRVMTPDAAEWALRRKAEHDAEIARIMAQAETAKRWIDSRARQLVKESLTGSAFFEAVLLDWMSRARGQIVRGKAKSAKFLFGTLGWRSKPQKLVYDDEAAALAWAKSRPVEEGLYRVEYKLEKDTIKALAKKENLVPPGARWEGGEDVAYVEAEAPAIPALPANDPLQLVKGGA